MNEEQLRKEIHLKMLAGLNERRRVHAGEVAAIERDMTMIMTRARQRGASWGEVGRAMSANRATVFKWYQRRYQSVTPHGYATEHERTA